MAYYNTCPFCGAHLDPNEKCSCHLVATKLGDEGREYGLTKLQKLYKENTINY